MNDSSTVQIDLHTRLADNLQLIPDIDVRSPLQWVEVAKGISLPTLGPHHLFAYLAVHGASSAWFRLKWIADFAALVGSYPPAEIEHLWARSQDLGAGRAADQALLLADSLFGSLEASGDLKQRLLRDRASKRLFKAALNELSGRAEPIEPTSRTLGTATIHWTQLLLLPGIEFKIAELLRQSRAAFL